MRLTALTNGPLIAQGPMFLVDESGHELRLGMDRVVALCRCGASQSKPLCDGSHTRNGFRCPPFEAREYARLLASWESEGGHTSPPPP